MTRAAITLNIFLALLLLVVGHGWAREAVALKKPVRLVRLVRLLEGESLKKPVHLAHLPDGSGRLVVVEQRGLIRWFRPGEAKSGGVLLDLRDKVSTSSNEEGLLSIAFHPAFRKNRTFYLYYSASSPRRSVISRFSAGESPLAANPAGEQVVLEVPQPFGNHNGGQLAFGPDGFLYIGLGDGGSGGDPHGHGQNRGSLLGSILRIDIDLSRDRSRDRSRDLSRDRSRGGLAYAIPADNPFAGASDGSRAEIWAYGLRNPWRFSFDRHTGALFAADVGQNEIEEVNIIERGGNYGWNIMEGAVCYKPRRNCQSSGLRLPVSQYTHSQGFSITGGFVYRGHAIPALTGRYLFGDFGSGAIWSIRADTAQMAEPEHLLSTKLAISSFGEDATGEIYILDWRGGIYRLEPAN